MRTNRSRPAVVILLALGGSALGCSGSGSQGVTQPVVATQLAFIAQPATATAGGTFASEVQVEVRDVGGVRVKGATNTVTLALGSNPGGASLSGTTTLAAVNGVATFANLSIDRPGTGYTLAATSGTLVAATSATFLVTVPFVGVSAGTFSLLSTCGVTTTGAAYCWGLDHVGELGNGVTGVSLTPVAVLGGPFTAVSVGGSPVCGVTTANAAYCWGFNDVGELGYGPPDQNPHPTPVAVSGKLPFVAVSAGLKFACGFTTTGVAYCWGGNDAGELGTGDTNSSTTPRPVKGGLTFKTVSAGASSACGVTTAGTTYCWGDGSRGELGVGTTTGLEHCGNGVPNPFPCSTSPVAVAGGHTFGVVSVGTDFACGVQVSDNMAYCWGSNDLGWLGNGSTTGSDTPIAVKGGVPFTTVSAGGAAACGVSATDGTAYCWGANTLGQLGIPKTGPQHCGLADTCSTTPIAVAGGFKFLVVSSGEYWACGVTTSNAAYCWGGNDSGQLGNGTTTDSSMPVRVVL